MFIFICNLRTQSSRQKMLGWARLINRFTWYAFKLFWKNLVLPSNRIMQYVLIYNLLKIYTHKLHIPNAWLNVFINPSYLAAFQKQRLLVSKHAIFNKFCIKCHSGG